jgi:NADH:ubiquinone reductase (H+-translocating)
MQQGRYVARLIRLGIQPEERRPFIYADRGMLSTIGRAQAVAQLGRFRFAGFFAWLLWCGVHIFFLIGFRNRVRVMLEWMWYYVTFKPGARVIYNLAQLSATARSRPQR